MVLKSEPYDSLIVREDEIVTRLAEVFYADPSDMSDEEREEWENDLKNEDLWSYENGVKYNFETTGDGHTYVSLWLIPDYSDPADEINNLKAQLAELTARNAKLEGDADSIGFLESNCLTLECYDSPTPGGDDGEVMWRVVEYHMGKPRERYIGYGNTPAKAIQAARQALGSAKEWRGA